jgi:hypothetical protein
MCLEANVPFVERWLPTLIVEDKRVYGKLTVTRRGNGRKSNQTSEHRKTDRETGLSTASRLFPEQAIRNADTTAKFG